MRKFQLPKKPHKGLKIYCRICRVDNPSCKHFEHLQYRIRIVVPGCNGSTRTKMLKSVFYEDAVKEAIEFKQELIANNYETQEFRVDEGNDYSVLGSIIRYNQYLQGNNEYAHLKRNITDEYRYELIRYCKLFARNLKQTKELNKIRITDIGNKEVSKFYTFLEEHYGGKTFNKCMSSIKMFFDFLIKIEKVDMNNPFEIYTAKSIPNPNVEIITQDEFRDILKSVDTYSPTKVLGGKGEKKTMYYEWLKDAFKLFLLTGGRREEIVELKWSDIFVSNGVKFFMIENLKVSRIKKQSVVPKKYFPINIDLEELLVEMGMNEHKNTSNYILNPNRTQNKKTIMNLISKAFTHYKNGAGIEKDITLKSLRKTYITWVKQVLGDDTGIITSQTDEVIEKFYIDPKVLSVVERSALKIKVFEN